MLNRSFKDKMFVNLVNKLNFCLKKTKIPNVLKKEIWYDIFSVFKII